MTKCELKELVQIAMYKQNDIYESLRDDVNPQVQKLAYKTKGQVDALSDVLAAINGNPVYIRMLAGK